MFGKIASVAICIACVSYTAFILCNLMYFLSNHNENKEAIASLKEDESIESVLWFLIVDVSLLSIFMLQHSLMATDFAKHLFCKLRIDYMERSIYNVASAISLHLLFNNWRTVSSVALWKVNTSSSDSLWFTFTAFHALAWTIIYCGCVMMDLGELSSIKQIYYKFSNRPSPMAMKSKGLLRFYSHMRHPSFTGFLIVLWIHPYMTLDRLFLASILTIYMASMWTIDKEDCDYHANLVKRKQRELS